MTPFQVPSTWFTCCWMSTSCTRSNALSVRNQWENSWSTLSTDTNLQNFQNQISSNPSVLISWAIRIWSEPSTCAAALKNWMKHPRLWHQLRPLLVKKVHIDVLYFNQQIGASHAICWSTSSFSAHKHIFPSCRLHPIGTLNRGVLSKLMGFQKTLANYMFWN